MKSWNQSNFMSYMSIVGSLESYISHAVWVKGIVLLFSLPTTVTLAYYKHVYAELGS